MKKASLHPILVICILLLHADSVNKHFRLITSLYSIIHNIHTCYIQVRLYSDVIQASKRAFTNAPCLETSYRQLESHIPMTIMLNRCSDLFLSTIQVLIYADGSLISQKLHRWLQFSCFPHEQLDVALHFQHLTATKSHFCWSSSHLQGRLTTE